MQASELSINSIGDLQIALIEDNNRAIQGYVERLDRETSNQAMQEAGSFFGFPTVEIEGVFRTSAGHLARVFGYKQPRSLADLLTRRGILGIKMGGFEHHTQIKIKTTLELDDNDRKSILYDWPAFLIGGMNSTNQEARAVQGYLLKMEKLARCGVVGIRRGLSPKQFPHPAAGVVMTKLSSEAWRGNPIASYVLESYYDVPATRLLQNAEDLRDRPAETIAAYLQTLMDDSPATWGIEQGVTAEGNHYLQCETTNLYNAFTHLGRQYKLPLVFKSAIALGNILGREADALESLGWIRSLPRAVRGHRYYRYERQAVH